MSTAPNIITSTQVMTKILGPDGEIVECSIANATDLVRFAGGYSWMPESVQAKAAESAKGPGAAEPAPAPVPAAAESAPAEASKTEAPAAAKVEAPNPAPKRGRPSAKTSSE